MYLVAGCADQPLPAAAAAGLALPPNATFVAEDVHIDVFGGKTPPLHVAAARAWDEGEVLQLVEVRLRQLGPGVLEASQDAGAAVEALQLAAPTATLRATGSEVTLAGGVTGTLSPAAARLTDAAGLKR